MGSGSPAENPGFPQGAYFTNYEYFSSPDYTTKNPLWVYEVVTKDNLVKKAYRLGMDFDPDDRIPLRYRVDDNDYKKSGYDKGHLACAANHTSNFRGLHETFMYTNCCPQLPEFNRGIWKELEEYIRTLIEKSERVWIVTIPVYENYDKKIGSHNVIVPTHFAKAILIREADGTMIMKSWLIPHQANLKNYNDYAISVDELEVKVGLNLWSELNDSLEKILESKK